MLDFYDDEDESLLGDNSIEDMAQEQKVSHDEPFADNNIEDIAQKQKVSEHEVVSLLEHMDQIDENLVSKDNDCVVKIVQASGSVPAAATVSTSTSPQIVSRSGRKVKKNPKYFE